MPLQVRKHINRFYKEAQNLHIPQTYLYNHQIPADSQLLLQLVSNHCFCNYYHLKIYNKSLARRLRKNYKANGSFYALCNQLGRQNHQT